LTDEAQNSGQWSKTLAALKGLDVVAGQLSPDRILLPEEAPTSQMLRQLGATEVTPAPPTDFLETVRRNLAAASRSGQFLPKDLRYAPWLLWNGKSPLASLPNLLPKVLDQARLPGRTLHHLIQAYLRDFEPKAPGINAAATTIREQLGCGRPRLDTWRAGENEARLFDPEHGPAALAERLIGPAQQPDAVLARYKLDDPLLANGKYMLAVEDAVRARAGDATQVRDRRAGTLPGDPDSNWPATISGARS
jgi:hypothetical protein